MAKGRKGPVRAKQSTQLDLNKGLEAAASSGDLAAFENFLQRGASLDASKADQNMLAIAGMQPAILNLLTNPTNGLYKQFNDGTTDLHLAAIRNDVDTIREIFEAHPERMLELTKRGESVLNWANYFMRHKVISYLLSCQAFVDNLEQTQTDDAYYDLARGHALLADYFKKENHHYYVPMYYEIAIEFYKLVKENMIDEIAEVESQLKNFTDCYPMVQPAAERGFVVEDVPGDGNCLFHAVVKQLETLHADVQLTSMDLREQAIHYMLEHPKAFRDFCVEDLDAYINKMVRQGVYADHCLILALSRALNLNFYILNSDGSKPIIIKQKDAAHCVYLGYIIENHYQSLRPVDGKLDAKVAQEIAEAEYDNVDAAVTMVDEGGGLSPCSSLAAEVSDDDLAGRDSWPWSDDSDDDSEMDPIVFERQNAFIDSMQLDGTIQPADTVQVVRQPVRETLSLLESVQHELNQAIAMVEDGLDVLEDVVRQAADDVVKVIGDTDVSQDLAELQNAARSLGDNVVKFIGTVTSPLVDMREDNLVSTPEIEMDAFNYEEIAVLAAATPSPSLSSSPFGSRSGSPASLGSTGLFAQPGVRSSPASTPDVPVPMRMIK